MNRLSYPLPNFLNKYCSIEQLDERLKQLEKPIVFTNGCFDVLHQGHVTYLAQARNLGNSLIVALNSDHSVKRQGKGDDRPLNPLSQRIAVISALESVTCVLSFDEDTPLALIERIRPDILVKGGDWAIETIVGSRETLARGGEVHSIPFEINTSTTALVNKIRNG